MVFVVFLLNNEFLNITASFSTDRFHVPALADELRQSVREPIGKVTRIYGYKTLPLYVKISTHLMNGFPFHFSFSFFFYRTLGIN